VCLQRGTSQISIYSSGYLPQRPGLDPRPVCVDLWWESGTETGFPPSCSVFPVRIILPTPYTHLYLHVALDRRTNGESLGIPKSHARWVVGDYCLAKGLTIFKQKINVYMVDTHDR
jgi:hypothetical protein